MAVLAEPTTEVVDDRLAKHNTLVLAVEQALVKVGPVKLIVRRTVQPFMLIGQRKLTNDLAGIMESKDISAGPNRQVGKCLAKTEVVKNMHRIGAELYAGADLAQLRRLLVDLDVIARLHQTGSRR